MIVFVPTSERAPDNVRSDPDVEHLLARAKQLQSESQAVAEQTALLVKSSRAQLDSFQKTRFRLLEEESAD